MPKALRFIKPAIVFIMLIFSVHALKAQKIIAKTETEKTVATKYGIYSIKDDIDSRLIAANNTVVDYVRQTTVLVNWNGVKDGGIDYWCSHKKKVVLNINYNSGPAYFPTNIPLYQSQLQSFLNVYADSIDMVAIENEELNSDTTHNLYHYGSIQSYINELTAAVSICNQKKIQVTNGGLATQVTASLKHYYDINGKTDSSQWLVAQMGGIPADSTVWKRCDSLLNAYRTIPLSYVNLHWYEPKKGATKITGVLQVVCNYITQQTGKKVISNESGTRSDSSFITQLMQQWSLVKPAYCILFDGNASNNNGALPLTSGIGDLLPSGMAYRDYIGGGKACTQTITVLPSGFVNFCSGDTLKLTASGGFTNYLWSTGETTQSITVKGAGNYSVKSNHTSCMYYTKLAAAVMMNGQPVQPIVTTNPSSLTNMCAGKNVQLHSSIAQSYLWTTGEKTKSISVKTAGNYTVTTSDINGCKATSSVMAVTYKTCDAPGKLKVTGISSNKATLNWGAVSCGVGYQLQYHVKGTQAWTTQQISGGSTTSKTITNLSANVYQWRMLTYCSYSPDTVKSAYVNGPDFTISKTLTNTENSIAASLDGFNINIYPVPAKNVASVSVSPVRSDLAITLMDIYGKVLWRKEKITDAVTQLPVANLASGMYMVVIKDKEHSKTLSLIKQ